jgi:ketosteroid isomerase-like protein
MSEDNVDTLRALYEALNSSDLEAVVQGLHPDIEIRSAFGGELDIESTYRGRDGMREFIETAWRGFELAIEPLEVISAPGDRIVAVERWQLRGRDGVETEHQLTDVYAFRDGLVVRVDGFREKAEALQAAGL